MKNFLFGYFLLHNENKMRKLQNKNSLVLKRQQKSSVLNPFLATDSYIVSFLKRKLESGEMHKRGEAFVILGSQQAAKHFHETHFFSRLPWSFSLVPPPWFGVSNFFHLVAAPLKGWCPTFLSQITGRIKLNDHSISRQKKSCYSQV